MKDESPKQAEPNIGIIKTTKPECEHELKEFSSPLAGDSWECVKCGMIFPKN